MTTNKTTYSDTFMSGISIYTDFCLTLLFLSEFQGSHCPEENCSATNGKSCAVYLRSAFTPASSSSSPPPDQTLGFGASTSTASPHSTPFLTENVGQKILASVGGQKTARRSSLLAPKRRPLYFKCLVVTWRRFILVSCCCRLWESGWTTLNTGWRMRR